MAQRPNRIPVPTMKSLLRPLWTSQQYDPLGHPSLTHANIIQGINSRPGSDSLLNMLRQLVKFSYNKSLK